MEAKRLKLRQSVLQNQKKGAEPTLKSQLSPVTTKQTLEIFLPVNTPGSGSRKHSDKTDKVPPTIFY